MANDTRLTFSSYFGVAKKHLDKEGFFNVSLISDLPLFIDPFHLFYSRKKEYRKLHVEIIDYLVFLRDQSVANGGTPPTTGIIDAYYRFPEVKQNWLGFTFRGNKGHGLGKKFATALNQNFYRLFRDLDAEATPRHLEKLTLVADRVGKDTISDFTTNLAHAYFAQRTEAFAKKYLDKKKTGKFTIKKAEFDYTNKAWKPKTFTLPKIDGDYVLLTPKDLLTKNDTWINKTDFIKDFAEIPLAAPNAALREQLSNYLKQKLQEYAKRKIDKRTNKVVLRITKETRTKAAWDTIAEYPESIDIYIRLKEERGDKAIQQSEVLVAETETFFQNQFANFAEKVGTQRAKPTSYEEALERAKYFKECIENRDCYLNLYNGDAPADEDWIQRMFWLVWYGAESDVNRDPSNGRGKPDYAVSQGRKDKTLIEFKLARSSSLEKNLLKQLKKYQEVDKVEKGIWVIVFFTAAEEQRVRAILEKHKLQDDPNYILVDARKDNKQSASKLK